MVFDHLLDIFDTAGQEDFSAVRDSYMNTGDGFIIMYSIIDLKSFNEVPAIHAKLEMIQEGAKVPGLITLLCLLNFVGVIVGNKCDSDDARQVTTDQGKALASQFGWGFLEASAKLRKNITEVFQEVEDKLLRESHLSDH
jgi:GTPase KRas protein